MPTEVALRCRCGHVRGTVIDVSPTTGTRIVCYCADCQAFARFLGREDVMDPAGGSDVFQIAPARVRIAEGRDALRCVRLSPKGLYRWYADCCRTPLANTVSAKVPVVSLIGDVLAIEETGRTRDQVLGPPLGWIHGRFAVPGAPAPAHLHPGAPFGVIARVLSRIARWRIAGMTHPNPFFDRRTGAPVVDPRVLTPAERAAAGTRPGAQPIA